MAPSSSNLVQTTTKTPHTPFLWWVVQVYLSLATCPHNYTQMSVSFLPMRRLRLLKVTVPWKHPLARWWPSSDAEMPTPASPFSYLLLLKSTSLRGGATLEGAPRYTLLELHLTTAETYYAFSSSLCFLIKKEGNEVIFLLCKVCFLWEESRGPPTRAFA